MLNLESSAFDMEKERSEDTESEQMRGTHKLESADGQTSQDTEGIQVSKGHSHPGERRWMDKSGHRRNLSEQGALTNWRAQMDRQVRTWKESK